MADFNISKEQSFSVGVGTKILDITPHPEYKGWYNIWVLNSNAHRVTPLNFLIVRYGDWVPDEAQVGKAWVFDQRSEIIFEVIRWTGKGKTTF